MSSLTKSFGNEAGSLTKSIGNEAGSLTKSIGNKASSLTKSIGNKASSLTNEAGSLTKSIGNKAGSLTNEAGSLTNEAGSLTNSVSQKLNTFKKSVPKTSGIYQTKNQDCNNNNAGSSNCDFTDNSDINLKKLIADSKSSCKNIKNLEDQLHKSQHNKFLHETGICSIVKDGKHQWGQINQTLFGPVCKTGNQKEKKVIKTTPKKPTIPKGYSDCLTKWQGYCSKKGPKYIIDDKKKCNNNKGYHIKCKQLLNHELDTNDFMTPCRPSTYDFEYECSQMGWAKYKNDNYGYQKIFFGENGHCMKPDSSIDNIIIPDNTMASAKCSQKYRRGVNIFGEYNQLTKCLPELSDFDKECKIFNNKFYADVIGGFDCVPGKQRAKCKITTSKPRFGDTKEKTCRYFCSKQ